MNQTKQSPHGNVGFETHKQSGLPPLTNILNRLEGVSKTPNGYVARCPAHNDRSPSLSLSEADNGKILVHCFAGCPVLDVLGAIQLELADLFPRRQESNTGSHSRGITNRWSIGAELRAAINVLALESEILLIGGRKSIAGTITFDDLERIALAVSRIFDARAVLNGRI